MHLEEVSLRHNLSDAEYAKMAREQSNAIEKKSVAEADLGAIKKDYAGRIALALAQAEVSSISQRINSGWEMRNIKCILADERPEGYRLVIRSDNGHVAKRRKLNPEERQMKLSSDPPSPYVASALLKVDDEEWKEVDVCQVPLYQDEYDLLKLVRPPISFMPIAGRHRQIEAPPSDPENPQPAAKKPTKRKK